MGTATMTPNIFGWGVDAEPMMRPGYPKEKTPEHGTGAHWARPQQQIDPRGKKKHSIERPSLTAVFGTTVPPRGLSGVIRNLSFRWSEAQLTHWLMLLLADRIDVVESLVVDLAHGRIPNLYQEMGLAAEWKYNRPAFFKRAAKLGLGAMALWGAVSIRRRR